MKKREKINKEIETIDNLRSYLIEKVAVPV
jgi:hypothetical protein